MKNITMCTHHINDPQVGSVQLYCFNLAIYQTHVFKDSVHATDFPHGVIQKRNDMSYTFHGVSWLVIFNCNIELHVI